MVKIMKGHIEIKSSAKSEPVAVLTIAPIRISANPRTEEES